MPSSEITRRFTIDDQQAFARLSGDCNPLHVDPVRARRLLFGACAVHGVHLALWALDRIAVDRPTIVGLSGLTLTFDAAAIVGEPVTLEPPTLAGDEIRVRLRGGGRTLARFRFRAGPHAGGWANPGPPPPETCRPITAEAMARQVGEAPLGFDPRALAALFPALAAFAPPVIAWLLAATRVVGMRAPGLHSLFTGLTATFAPPAGATLAYRVAAWDDRFQLAVVALRGGGGEGEARALLRPPPVDQRSLDAVAAEVGAGRFAGASALVIGGTRGLGEAAVKVFAAGGAAVTMTYRDGADDAERLAQEIGGAGCRVEIRRLDVAGPARALAGAALAPFTHVVYCAAPRIRKAGAGFDAAAFDRYRAFFVTGLDQALREAEPLLASTVTLIVPSTIYIDRPEPGFAEYAAAKVAGETVAADAAACLRAAGRTVILLQPRFDRLATDQTAAPGAAPAADAAAAFLALF